MSYPVIFCFAHTQCFTRDIEPAPQSSVMIKGYELKRNSSQDNCSEIVIVPLPLLVVTEVETGVVVLSTSFRSVLTK